MAVSPRFVRRLPLHLTLCSHLRRSLPWQRARAGPRHWPVRPCPALARTPGRLLRRSIARWLLLGVAYSSPAAPRPQGTTERVPPMRPMLRWPRQGPDHVDHCRRPTCLPTATLQNVRGTRIASPTREKRRAQTFMRDWSSAAPLALCGPVFAF